MNKAEMTAEEYLAEHGRFETTTSGISMYPLLRDRQYAVTIVPASGRLKKYDVALFRRGEQLVLHRVIKVLPDCYCIRGDNCDKGETVSESQIVGVLSEITGKDKHIKTSNFSYKLYSRLTVLFHPLRHFPEKVKGTFNKVYRFIRRTAKRILKGKNQ